jgi:hypothetical protein
MIRMSWDYFTSFLSIFRTIKVYSHPRSGTHFVENFLGHNFYLGQDLSLKPITWGHWSNRLEKREGNPYGRLFGGHGFPTESIINSYQPIVYIYRDGRAVAYSVWKTPNFLNAEQSQLSFSAFLRTPLDWKGSPGKRVNRGEIISQHWYNHVDAWHQAARENQNILIVRYEDLKNNPRNVYDAVKAKFFKFRLPTSANMVRIDTPVGLLPNRATVHAYEKVFSDEDLMFFRNSIPSEKYLWDLKQQ